MLYTENNEILNSENNEVFRIEDSILDTYQLAAQYGSTIKYWSEGRYHNGKNVTLNANNTAVSPVNLGTLTPVNSNLKYFTKNQISYNAGTENIKCDGTLLKNVNKFLYTCRAKINSTGATNALVRILTNVASANSRLRIYITSTTTIDVYIQKLDGGSSDNSTITLSNSITDGNFHTFQVYVDYTANTKKTFLDGILLESKSISLGAGTTTSNTNSSTNRDAIFGGNPSANASFCYLSMITDGNLISDSDILKLYNYSKLTETES